MAGKKGRSGRKSDFTVEMGKEICARLAEGESLSRICQDDHISTRGTVLRWLFDDDPDKKIFRDEYERARQAQAAGYADDINDIADDARNDFMAREDPDNPGYNLNGEHIQRSRLRTDTRKWIASRILHNRFGDRLKTDVSGEVKHTHSLDLAKLDKEERAELRRLLEKAAPDEQESGA